MVAVFAVVLGVAFEVDAQDLGLDEGGEFPAVGVEGFETQLGGPGYEYARVERR